LAGARMRLLRGLEIVLMGGQIRRVSRDKFLVKSQKGNGWYEVVWRNRKWRCSCADYKKRKKDCKHIYAVLTFLNLPSILMRNLTPELNSCPRCGAGQEYLVKIGCRKNRSGPVRRFKCKKCGHTFTERLAFKSMRSDPFIIVLALDLYLKGLSTRMVAHHLSTMYGYNISHMTIYRWFRKYVKLISAYVKKLKPRVGKRWHADEMKVSIDGKPAYLWNILDRKTRFLLASYITTSRGAREALRVLETAIERAGIKPTEFVTDGLSSYSKAVEILKIKRHVRNVKFSGKTNNNVIESLHSTLKPRIKAARRMGSKKSAREFAEAISIYYNFIRPHLTLRDRTPSKKAEITIENTNPLLTLILRSGKKPSAH